MKVSLAENQKWVPYPGQRATDTSYRTILDGEKKTRGNFQLSLIRIGETGSFSPRHRHNFEQFRLPLNIEFNQSPKQGIPKDHLGYIPEGTSYGPQDVKPGVEFLLLQSAGPSGAGYMSHDELMEGTESLKKEGEFSGGVFRRKEKGGPSDRLNQDAYEAVWEHVNQRPIAYAKPRYLEPVTIDPEAFAWVDVPGAEGVKQKHLGTFNEHGTSAWQIRLDPRARYEVTADRGRKLITVLSGSTFHEGKAYAQWSGFDLSPGESVKLQGGDAGTLLLILQLPLLDS